MIKSRYLETQVVKDLAKKMVFIGGPRQVGKTTLAKSIGEQQYSGFLYLNWDYPDHRMDIQRHKFPAGTPLVIFDELHKYRPWKNYIKGLYDVQGKELRFLVTGSARLDIYRRGGDSLMGRYQYLRLHPFSLRETIVAEQSVSEPFAPLAFAKPTPEASKLLLTLLRYGGFPEPFFSRNDLATRRFQLDRADRLVREDIRDLEQLRDLSLLHVLIGLLPAKVGSLLSLTSLHEDLQVTHKTVALWMDVLERFYYHYRIYPFASTKIKSLRKQPKMYLWDWAEVVDSAARFENMIASHLLKFVHLLHDAYGYRAELFFLRDNEGREVDFLVAVDRKPWFIVEAKMKNLNVETPIKYFANKLAPPFVFQVVEESGHDYSQNGVRVMSADKFLTGLV